MAPTVIFPCGHSASLDNIVSILNLRCLTCAREAAQARAKVGTLKVKRQDQNMSGYEGRVNVPELGANPSVDQLPKASHTLLKAIFREHPYVFDAAERAGRLAVRP